MTKRAANERDTCSRSRGRREVQRRAVAKLLEDQADVLFNEAARLLLEGAWSAWADSQPPGATVCIQHEQLVSAGDEEVARLAALSAALRAEADRLVAALRGPGAALH